MKVVLSYVKPYKWYAICALVLMLVELAAELVQPLIISKIIDDGIILKDLHVISLWGGLLIGISLIAFASGIFNTYYSAHVAQSFAFDLRNALFSKIQSFSMAIYLKYPTSSLITRLTSDVQQVQSVLFMSLRIMLRAPLSVVLSLMMAFFVNAEMALMLMIGTPILAIFLYVIVKKGSFLFSEVQRRMDKLNRALQESLQAIYLVKAFMRNHYEMKKFHQVAEDLKVDTMKALRTMELMMPLMAFVLNVSLLFAIWYGAKEISMNRAQVGEMVAVVNYALRITGYFGMFAFILNSFSRAKASSERMAEILIMEEGMEKADGLKEEKVSAEIGAISFKEVSFIYPNTKKPVLQDITFDVKKGEKLAIMGATGSGKSTLLSLIPRFFEPTKGEILVDGKDIKEWPLKKLRSMIGYVPQKSLLFTGTIEDNVKWGKREAAFDEVVAAAKRSQIHETISAFPEGYDTMVGQKGVNLSGGQKQRLSIARALIRKPQILILDDSTSALDVKTEAALWEALKGTKATMLVVTQKIHTAKGADRILLLDEGKISAIGTHEELMQSSELYQQIAHSQEEQVGDE
ncbi:ABC transporter ATP-binding protein [Ureibacillus thermophilus]|uniref:ABC transporter ATP-binding protein n=1 Tax=Ureibacillus thermophilus TaxID=367743 RepID=A0A4P6UQC0_9BACL|nr:ABC transporter ATP-binding protein [Ureibacillus thermophilus]QBK24635.1 ABC transporter ATP-binding protein [Ureibacillus thermophilus]